MAEPDETAELRSLQKKAYGRDGGLVETDVRRLRELEQRRDAARSAPLLADRRRETSSPHVAPGAEADAEARTASAAPSESVSDPVAADTASVARSTTESVEVRERRPVLRETLARHWKAVSAASALLLVAGIGAGWALAPRQSELSLTAAQQERRVELQTGGSYDDGSVRAIGQDETALVWYGTKDDGAMACLVLDVGDRSTGGCQRGTDISQGFGVGLQLGDGDTSEQVSASAVQSTSGEIVAWIQRWRAEDDAWFSQFFGEERTRAQELIDEGYEEYSFSIVGYFGGEPVWHASRFDEVTAKECLIVDAVGATQCVPQEETLSPGAGIVVEGASVDTIDGGSEPWSISLGFTSARSTYLTIRGDAAGERSSVPEDDAPGS
nr:hypothetical protein [uncultured Microbacterium sp.]